MNPLVLSENTASGGSAAGLIVDISANMLDEFPIFEGEDVVVGGRTKKFASANDALGNILEYFPKGSDVRHDYMVPIVTGRFSNGDYILGVHAPNDAIGRTAYYLYTSNGALKYASNNSYTELGDQPNQVGMVVLDDTHVLAVGGSNEREWSIVTTNEEHTDIVNVTSPITLSSSFASNPGDSFVGEDDNNWYFVARSSHNNNMVRISKSTHNITEVAGVNDMRNSSGPVWNKEDRMTSNGHFLIFDDAIDSFYFIDKTDKTVVASVASSLSNCRLLFKPKEDVFVAANYQEDNVIFLVITYDPATDSVSQTQYTYSTDKNYMLYPLNFLFDPTTGKALYYAYYQNTVPVPTIYATVELSFTFNDSDNSISEIKDEVLVGHQPSFGGTDSIILESRRPENSQGRGYNMQWASLVGRRTQSGGLTVFGAVPVVRYLEECSTVKRVGYYIGDGKMVAKVPVLAIPDTGVPSGFVACNDTQMIEAPSIAPDDSVFNFTDNGTQPTERKDYIHGFFSKDTGIEGTVVNRHQEYIIVFADGYFYEFRANTTNGGRLDFRTSRNGLVVTEANSGIAEFRIVKRG